MNIFTENILRNKSVQATAMRILVLEQFLQQQKAQSLADLEIAMPRADRTTIFRTLKTFLKKGILHEVNDGSSSQRYALCGASCRAIQHQDEHPHFHCLACEQTVCLNLDSTPLPNLPEGYQTQSFELMVKGICPKCVDEDEI